MGPEIYGAGQGGASGGSPAFEPVHVEIVKPYDVVGGAGAGRFLTPNDRFVRYQGPFRGPYDPEASYDIIDFDFANVGFLPAILPFRLADTFEDYSDARALGPFPAGLYYVEHSGILDADPALHDASFFDGMKTFLVRVPQGAEDEDDFYAQYNDPWTSELSATRTGGDNGGPPNFPSQNELQDWQGYRSRMTGMIHLNEGDSIVIIGDFAGVSESFMFYWNRLVVRKIGEAVPKLQSGDDDWAP